MSIEALKTKPSEYARGRDAAQADVALEELCTRPSREYLEGYFYEQCDDGHIAIIMAVVVPRVEVGKLDETVATLRELPRDVLSALARALVGTCEVNDDEDPM